MARFVTSDNRQPFLMPPDLRDWLPDDDIAHFILGAAERVNMAKFHVNERGSGSAQYHPRMMLALLVYSYVNGVFSSRRIERATYRDIGCRFITANLNPDHDTIAKFRRENLEAFSECFLEVLLLAKELKLLRVGTVSVDGTQIKANASKNRNVRYDRAQELRKKLKEDIDTLIKQAEKTDREEERDPQSLPEELSRRETLKAKLDEACEALKRAAKKRAEGEREEYEKKVKSRDNRKGRRKGRFIKPPDDTVRDETQTNLTDSDSRLMRKNKRSGYEQAYNAQAVVDAEGSQLILGQRITQCASDRNELATDVLSIDSGVGLPDCVLADSGYASGDEIKQLEEAIRDIEVLVATGRTDHEREYDFRPERKPKPLPKDSKQWIKDMKKKMETDEAKALYKLRQQTVEPVFGIIKATMGFRQFLLRGLNKIELEWCLVTLAYNCKRLHNLTAHA